jgi:O-antigen/teichoic acid export membrane protein
MKSSAVTAADPAPAPEPARGLGSRLAGNSAWNTGSFMVSTLLMIAAAPLYIHYIGLNGYGLFLTLNTILSPLSLLNFGFGQATVKYVAEKCSINRVDEAGRYLQSTLLFNLVLGLAGALLIWTTAVPLAEAFNIDRDLRAAGVTGFRLVAAGWLFNQVAVTFTAVPTALQQFRLTSFWTSVLTTGGLALGLFVLAVGGSFTQMFLARAVWGAITALIWGLIARRLLPTVSLWPKYNRAAFRRSFHFGVWQTVSTVGGMLNSQSDKFLLTRFWGLEAAGVYGVPLTAFQQVYGLVSRLAEVLFPAISELHGKGRQDEMTSVMFRGSWLVGLAMVVCQGTLFVFAGDALRIYLRGRLPEVATEVLRLYCAGAIVTAATPAVTQFLLGTGQTGWMAAMSVGSGVIALTVNLLLIPRLGVAGAAWGALMSSIVSRPVFYYLLWLKIFRRTTSFAGAFAALLGCSVPGLLATLCLAVLHDRWNPRPGWIGLVFLTPITALLIGGAIVLTDRLLPGSAARRRDLRSLSQLALRRLVKPKRRG